MSGIVDFIFGADKPDDSAQKAQLAEMKRQNDEQSAKFAQEKDRLDAEERKRQEELSSKSRARRSGGTRSLMSAQRLTPEEGIAGEDSSMRATLGPKA